MDFRWNEWNIEHIGLHGVTPDEAELVVRNAKRPYPRYRDDGKWLAWGRGRGGRLLQVVFVIDEHDSIFIIHARPLTEKEKKRYRKRGTT
jgi:uncharacterized DUF497 family protein